ncbi:MAG: dihydrodipicolinate synthase family protein [Kiritimatiellae bacterium]|nr:dihydrodipicolinate synthase family protein [Kiritimatiellia bacterium]
MDFKGLRNFVDFIITAGSKCLLLTYGVSLYSVLTDQEIAEVTKVVAEHNAGRAMVVAADGMWWTGKEVEFAEYAREVGADLLMVLPPDWGFSCTPKTMADHYAAVAEHIPVMAVSGVWIDRSVDFAFETLKILSETVDGVVALKDDSYDAWRGGGNFGRKAGLMVHDKWAIMCVWKENFLDASHYGCDGYLSPYLMFKPIIAHNYWKAIESGDEVKARQIITEYEMPLYDVLKSCPGGFDAGMHGIYELFGIVKRWRRKPYYNLNDEEIERLADFFKGLSLL